jgi:hypothetical protein
LILLLAALPQPPPPWPTFANSSSADSWKRLLATRPEGDGWPAVENELRRDLEQAMRQRVEQHAFGKR